jgi:hypothetical protein
VLAARLSQDHQDIERSAAERDRHPLGEKLATVRKHLKTAEF